MPSIVKSVNLDGENAAFHWLSAITEFNIEQEHSPTDAIIMVNLGILIYADFILIRPAG